MLLVKRRNILFAAMFAALLAALFGLSNRYWAERGNKTVALVTDYKDIVSLSQQSKETPLNVWHRLAPKGVVGITVPEYTGNDVAAFAPMSVRYGSASSLGVDVGGAYKNSAILLVDASSQYADAIAEYLVAKMPSASVLRQKNDVVIALPGTIEEFAAQSLLPDFQGLDFCKKNNIIALFRPGPCTASSGKDSASALDIIFKAYPCIKNIIPAGMIMSGYPDLKPEAEVLKKYKISLANVEFVKQIGVSQFASLMKPDVLPLHSLTKEEIITKRISQQQIIERYVRAVHERSIRVIIVHPYDLQLGDRLTVFENDLASIHEAVSSRGYDFGWPHTFPDWPSPFFGSVACALVFVFCGWFYLMRLSGDGAGNISSVETGVLIAASVLLSLLTYKIPFAAKLLGGFCGAAAATESALTALESSEKPFTGSVSGLFLLIAGGLSIASFYGTSDAALRLEPFSGVKLTLLLPPLLLLIHDLTRRIHDESLPEIIARPAVWGELALIGVMILALLVMALRSDNVSSVPAFEVAFRDFMERTLVVRPRTKEFLIGYPALVLYWYLVRKELAPHYREAVRIAAVLAFSSAVNTFCHFHTLLTLSVIRVINGWWLGLIVGVACVAGLHFVAMPLARKIAGRRI